MDLTGFGIGASAVATLIGSYALIQARRTERKSADQVATQQSFEMQGAMLDRYAADNVRLQGRVDDLHAKVNEALGRLAEMTVNHRECEERLESAEARLAALGGTT